MYTKDRLKILIDRLGLKLKDFSRKTGIPYQSLLKYLSGERTPTEDNLKKIAIHLGVNLNWLLTGEGEMFIRKGGGGEKIDIKDIPIHNIKEWLDEFWANASDDEKAWLKVEFGRAFPEYKEWLLKKELAEERNPPISQTSGAA